ncbi:MAG: peptidylprolyl isomerase [Campylobacterota bacterium]
MIKIVLAIFISTLLLAEESGSKQPKKFTLAYVNGKMITQVDIKYEVDRLMPETFYHSTVTDKKLAKVEAEALKNVIDNTLLYQHAKKQGLSVSDEEIEESKQKTIATYRSKEHFQAAVEKYGYSMPAFDEALRVKMLLEKQYDKEIRASFTQDELKDYYEKNKYKFKEPEKLHIWMIYVKNDPTDPKGREKARVKIEEAEKKIKEGADFGDIAAKYSNAMSRIKGGNMGYLHKGRLEPFVDKVAFALKPGEMSAIIEEDIGCYLVKVEDKKPARQLAFDDIKTSLEKDLVKKTQEQRKSDLLKRLKEKADIKWF